MTPAPPATTFPAFGTVGRLVVRERRALAAALRIVQDVVDGVDAAASRFRPDSEVSRLAAAAGRTVAVTPVLAGAVAAALRAAEATAGLVDPTVGASLRLLGYDADLAALPADRPAPLRVVAAPGWRTVELDEAALTLRVPPGVELDLGATGKAYAADVAAGRVATRLGTGVLVAFGGDVSVAGPAPEGGWPVLVRDEPEREAPDEVVAVREGGLATSSTRLRRWRMGGRLLHHIVDPVTGLPARSRWRTVTVAGATCVDANAATTAAVVLDDAAPAWLAARGLPARLVADDGTVHRVGAWPTAAAEVPA